MRRLHFEVDLVLNGAEALALLSRNRIPKVFGITVGYDTTDTSNDPKIPTVLRLALVIDRERAAPVLSLAITSPDWREERITIDTLHGLHNYQVVTLANALELPRKSWEPLMDAAQHLYRVLIGLDALAIVLDPLVMEPGGRLISQNAQVHIDESATFRHPEFAMGPTVEEDDERLARMAGISYKRMGGQIGIIANGAGLAMATMDVITALGRDYGLRPANFMDIGGGARADTVETGLRLLLTYHELKAIIFNVFGGMTRADEVAQGILSAASDDGLPIPIIVRMTGVQAQSAHARLEQAGLANLQLASSLNEAARAAIQAAKGS